MCVIPALKHDNQSIMSQMLSLGTTSQVFLAIEWLVDNVNPKFVLKTDDDAYVDTAHMVTALKELCQQPSCEDERYRADLSAPRCYRKNSPEQAATRTT